MSSLPTVNPMPRQLTKASPYAEVTKAALAQVAYYMHSSRRCMGDEALAKREIAFGVYLGWRALVETHPDRQAYLQDGMRLEALLNC